MNRSKKMTMTLKAEPSNRSQTRMIKKIRRTETSAKTMTRRVIMPSRNSSRQ